MYNYKEIREELDCEIMKNPWFDEYQQAGCYAIYVEDKIAYIGRSKNMARRFIEHIEEIKKDKPQYGKYTILHQAWKLGFQINFKVFHIGEDEDDIGREEAELINFFKPPLNTIIPVVDDWKHKYTKSNTPYTITLTQLLDIQPKGFSISPINVAKKINFQEKNNLN